MAGARLYAFENLNQQALILDFRPNENLLPRDIVNSFCVLSNFDDGEAKSEIISLLSQNEISIPLLVVLNQNLILDIGFIDNFTMLLNEISSMQLAWSLATPTGKEISGVVHNSIYSATHPCIITSVLARPVIDTGLDLVLVNLKWLKQLEPDARSKVLSHRIENMFQYLIIAGYLSESLSFYSPRLSAGVNGPLLSRDHSIHENELINSLKEVLMPISIPSLSGSVKIPQLDGHEQKRLKPRDSNLAIKYTKTVSKYCDSCSLSIVTRTKFERIHLLKRLLTSLERAKNINTKIEVILSTNIHIDSAKSYYQKLKKEFPHLTIKLAINKKEGVSSRVLNLVEGVKAADNDYVVIVDDDDYIEPTALTVINDIGFLASRPLLFVKSDVYREKWIQAESGNYILAVSEKIKTYWPIMWRKMFSGVNQLPICSLISPTYWLKKNIETFNFMHDLSEDYALFLHLLSTPDLPQILESNNSFCNISIRGAEENTVEMLDRRTWVSDISCFLADLALKRPTVGLGVLQLLSLVNTTNDSHNNIDIDTPDSAIRIENLGLKRDLTALRLIIQKLQEKNK